MTEPGDAPQGCIVDMGSTPIASTIDTEPGLCRDPCDPFAHVADGSFSFPLGNSDRGTIRIA